MAEPVTIARPYAEAAFRLACEQNALSAWSDALALINAVVADAQIAALIDAPNVGAAQLEGVIIGAVGKHLSGEARNFVQVLVQNRVNLALPTLPVRAQLRSGAWAARAPPHQPAHAILRQWMQIQPSVVS